VGASRSRRGPSRAKLSPQLERLRFGGLYKVSKKSFAKIILAAGVIAIGSASFGGPVFAAVKLGSDHLAQLAASAATESSVLALLGTGFLFVASAVRRLKTTEN
jgi:hypothetical protein